MSDATPDYHLSATETTVHHDWDPDRPPVRTVEPGAVITVETREAPDGSLDVDSTADDVLDRDFQGHPLTGPVAVEGASLGDVLVVDLLDIDHHGVGFSYYLPSDAGKGLLPDDFDDAGLHVWELDGDVGYFVDGIEVPLDPFPGNIGVAPRAPGPHSTTPPRHVGGNLDVKHLTAGSTLYLPVAVEGAHFSVGDGHAAQGDGEVCLTGIETALTLTARLDVRDDIDIDQPRFETDGPFTPTGADERMYATTGIDDDLMGAARLAVRHMIDHLHDDRGLSRGEAYILCSAAVDLKINEVVDAPNWVVSAYVAESLFP